MTVTNTWWGAPLSTSVVVATQVTSTSNVRVATSLTGAFAGEETYHGPVTPNATFSAKVNVTGLSANTRYYYRVEHAGVLNSTFQGRLRTRPNTYPMNYTLATGSCAGTNPDYPDTTGGTLASMRYSNHPVFAAIRNRDPLLVVHTGDLHYLDLSQSAWGTSDGTASLSNFRRGYNDVLLQTNQHQLYREHGIAYTWDDHDFLGNDRRGAAFPTEGGNALTVYKERVPHYPLGNATDGNYHEFIIGRTKFVVLDCRMKASNNSATDDSSKTMLGTTQKNWFKSILTNSTAEAMVVFTSSQWAYTNHADSWDVFTTEAAELTAHINSTGWANRICMITGDRHSSLIAPRGGSECAWPYAMFSSFDSSQSGITTSPDYTEFGPWRGQYGTIGISDPGVGPVAITLSVWHMNSLQMRYTFTTAGEDSISLSGGHASPSHVIAL